MAERRISKLRLTVNGIGCIGIAILCLPMGFEALISIASNSPPFGADPDGADKVLGIEIFSGLVGAIAFISLIRTVKTWRRLPKEE